MLSIVSYRDVPLIVSFSFFRLLNRHYQLSQVSFDILMIEFWPNCFTRLFTKLRVQELFYSLLSSSMFKWPTHLQLRRGGYIIHLRELIFINCGLFVLILVFFVCCSFFHYVSAKFHLWPSSGDLQRPRIGMLSLVTVSPVITAFHSCCLSHHVFDQVNLCPVTRLSEVAVNHPKKARSKIWPKRSERRNNNNKKKKNYQDEDKKSAINKN